MIRNGSTMKVYVNDKPVMLRKGMKVKHALSMRQLDAVKAGRLDITDSSGNIRGLEGSLTEGSKLYTLQAGHTAHRHTGEPPAGETPL